MSLAEIQKGVSKELRWFSSAHGLIERSDRHDVVLERSMDVKERYNKVLELSAQAEAIDGCAPDKLTRLLADVDQCMNMAAAITQKAADIRRQRESSHGGDIEAPVAHQGSGSRLPAITLAAFDGVSGEWTSFINLFDSLVHLRSDITKTVKMAQLVAALRGEPRELVAHLTVTEGNYETARQLLIRRYHNKRRLADAQLKRLFSIPVVTKVGAIQSEVLNPLLSVTKALENLGLPVGEWSYLLLYIVLSRLPVDVQTRFEQSHGRSAEDLPAFSDLVGFLEEESRRAENLGLTATHPSEPQRAVGSAVSRGTPTRRDSTNRQSYGTFRMLEVCVDSLESALNAIHGEADELEICSSLPEGGLTPTAGLVKEVIKAVDGIRTGRPIHERCGEACSCLTLVKRPKVNVMLRCRTGSDFFYSQEDMDTMLADLSIFKSFRIDRFVFGALDQYRNIHHTHCKKIIEAASPIPVTFHRAFDMSLKPLEAIEEIIELGFNRLLTSGQKATAMEGIRLIHSLVEKSEGRILIMPGAGVTADNVGMFIECGCKIVHGSCKVVKELPKVEGALAMGTSESESIFVTDEASVRTIMKEIWKSF